MKYFVVAMKIKHFTTGKEDIFLKLKANGLLTFFLFWTVLMTTINTAWFARNQMYNLTHFFLLQLFTNLIPIALFGVLSYSLYAMRAVSD